MPPRAPASSMDPLAASALAAGRVALVSYYFPPTGGAGTQRAAKLCRYLPELDWHPTVLCAEPASAVSHWTPQDDSLLANVAGGLAIERQAGTGPPWAQWAAQRVAELAGRGAIDAAIVTMSPFWLSTIVECCQGVLPVIADLRDPWALDGVPIYGHYFHWRRERRAMAGMLHAAHTVVMNTPEARNAVLRSFSGVDPARIHAIPNGFDSADFKHATPPARPLGARFVLVHTGTFLTNRLDRSSVVRSLKSLAHYQPEPIRPLGRTILPLLAAIEHLRGTRPALMEGFRFVHVGTLDDATAQRIHASPIRDLVHTTGYVPHEQSIGWLLAADALFLHLHGLPPGHRARIVPGKTYEYLASGRPILGALPAGDAADLLSQRAHCRLADPCDARSIADALASLIETGPGSGLAPLADTGIEDFDRRAIAGRFASLLNAAVGAPRP